MGDLSEHFATDEFRDHRTGRVQVDPRLVECLERLRHIIGDRPIRILSGYRSPATNRAVGGAPNSQHLSGRAADIDAQLRVNIPQAREAGFTGIGYNWRMQVVHVDVRPGGRVVEFLDV